MNWTFTIDKADDNIGSLRARYPDGLHFVVGDTHGACATLMKLMDKIAFDPAKDHIYFLGDYNKGGNIAALMQYLAAYYQQDMQKPGFHLIRGNHERELGPIYPLPNLPDCFVLRRRHLTYYLTHAGMITEAFQLINSDLTENPEQTDFAYRLSESAAGYDAPLRQLTWSRRGLYRSGGGKQRWPSEELLQAHHACIMHGHTPYCFMKHSTHYSYGNFNLFWQNQHILFSEDLYSFNLDSNIKGRYENGESYRGLTCICLEVCEEIAAQNGNRLTIDGIMQAENGVFGMPHCRDLGALPDSDIRTVTDAKPDMKTITLDENGVLCICSRQCRPPI